MLLKRGSKSNNVKRLQRKLNLNADGTFGPKTENAVKEFQKKNGLKIDGIVGPITWNKIMGFDIVISPIIPKQNTELKLDNLKGHIPDSVISQIPETVTKFKIDTALELSHFLSQCAHESGGFKIVNENLNYTAVRLRKIFPTYFPGVLAEDYAKKPEKIASRAYGGRMGNGPEETAEGWKYRGRGYIQLTGKNNYTEFDKFVEEDILKNPDLVATKYPLLSAAWFFSRNCLSKCIDDSDATVRSVTRCVNGGVNGLSDRLNYFRKYYDLLK